MTTNGGDRGIADRRPRKFWGVSIWFWAKVHTISGTMADVSQQVATGASGVAHDDEFAQLEAQLVSLRSTIVTTNPALAVTLPDTSEGTRRISELRRQLEVISSLSASASSAKGTPPAGRAAALGRNADLSASGPLSSTTGSPKDAQSTGNPVDAVLSSKSSLASLRAKYSGTAAKPTLNPLTVEARLAALASVSSRSPVSNVSLRQCDDSSSQLSGDSSGFLVTARDAVSRFPSPRSSTAFPPLFASTSDALTSSSPQSSSRSSLSFEALLGTAKCTPLVTSPQPQSQQSATLSPAHAAVTPSMLRKIVNKQLPEWARNPNAGDGKEDAASLIAGMRVSVSLTNCLLVAVMSLLFTCCRFRK